ncbi:hypothetical protein DYB38_002920 [Aphanomyces astaci]|uniref:Protein FAM184A/B N-terminal domain-containing protein n=1 Tax=Aphanomyces astaci TaxID=112090 RepID=A0A397DKJ7_APHAT|nr:hypothetical protein DYB38_002920 [Aphanomyces astaci]
MDADLHMKMSKKIAQLTKVIFHLNTKNEDAAMELQATVYSHRKENDMLAKEAASKMGQLKDALDKREAQLKAMDNVKKVKERHQLDKAERLDEFKRYKEEVKAHQLRVEGQFQVEMETLASELRKARGAFHERVAELKAALDAVQAKAANGHDQLKADHGAKLAALEKAHQFQLQQIAEKADIDAKLAVKRRELECNSSADSMKNDMVAKELQHQITSVRASFQQVEMDFHNEKRTAFTMQQSANATLADAKANLNERQHQVTLLEAELVKIRSQAEAVDLERRQLQKSVDKLQSETQSTSSKWEKHWGATIKALEADVESTKQQLKDKAAEVQKLHSLVKSMDAQHTKSEDEVKMQLLAAQKKCKELQSNVAANALREASLLQQLEACQNDLKQMQDDKTSLRGEFHATEGKLHSTIALLQDEIRVLKQHQGELIRQHDNAIQQLQSSAQSMSQAQKADMESQVQELKAQLDRLTKQLADAQEALSTSQNVHAQVLEQLKTSLAECNALQNQLKQAEVAGQKDRKDWRKQLAALELDKDKAAKQAKKDKTAMDKLENDLQAAKHKAELNGRSHLEVVAALKHDHDSHAATCAAMDLERQASEKKWQETSQGVQKNHEDVLRQILATHEAELEATKGELTLQFNAAKSQLMAEKDQLVATHAQDVTKLNQVRKLDLEAAATELSRKLAELRDKMDKEQRLATATLTAQHAQVVSTFENTVESCNATIARHVGSILGLERDKKALQQTISQNEIDLVQKELYWQREKDQALELARKHHKVEVEQTIEVHLHETQALNNQFEKTRALLQDQLQQLVGKIREWEQVYARRDSRLEDLNRIADLEQGTK